MLPYQKYAPFTSQMNRELSVSAVANSAFDVALSVRASKLAPFAVLERYFLNSSYKITEAHCPPKNAHLSNALKIIHYSQHTLSKSPLLSLSAALKAICAFTLIAWNAIYSNSSILNAHSRQDSKTICVNLLFQ